MPVDLCKQPKKKRLDDVDRREREDPEKVFQIDGNWFGRDSNVDDRKLFFLNNLHQRVKYDRDHVPVGMSVNAKGQLFFSKKRKEHVNLCGKLCFELLFIYIPLSEQGAKQKLPKTDRKNTVLICQKFDG